MYEWFEVEHFRCFERLRIEDLARINLIAGRNNAGKTALLEAFFVHASATNLASVITVDAFRGLAIVQVVGGTVAQVPWYDLFFRLDSRRPILLTGRHRDGKVRQLQLNLSPQPAYPVSLEAAARSQPGVESSNGGVAANVPPTAPTLEGIYSENGHELGRYRLSPVRGFTGLEPQPIFEVSPSPQPPPFRAYYVAARRPMSADAAAQLFSELELQGRDHHVLSALRIIEPNLRRLTVLVRGQHAAIYGDVGLPQLTPLGLMGEGMVYLSHVALAMATAPGGVVLVDEVENGIHHSVLRDLWTVVGRLAAGLDVQVIATTHSYECIAAARDALAATPGTLRLHRLERSPEGVRVITYDDETLDAAIQTDLEVR